MVTKHIDLAAYLAVHHHQNNIAMGFNGPSTGVRLLLSYVLSNIRKDTSLFVQSVRYRTLIDTCHQEMKKVQQQFEANEIDGETAERKAAMYLDKAEIAHQRLWELNNA